MKKVGRYTAALLLVTVGVLRIIDLSKGSYILKTAAIYWPLFLILFGLEYLLVHFLNRNSENRLKFDFGGLFLSILITGAVILFTQAGNFSFPWSFNASDNLGLKFDKGITKIELNAAIEHVKVNDLVGDITIKSAAVSQIEVETTVIIGNLKQDEAQKVADYSTIENSSNGKELTIEAKGGEWNGFLGIKRKPRMNLIITLPNEHLIDLDVTTEYGALAATGVQLKSKLVLKTINGSIHLADMNAKINAKTSNGTIEATNLSGSSELNTINGSFNLNNMPAGVIAHTVNGSVEISSPTIGGDWNLESTNGSVDIKIPSQGDYKINGGTTVGSIYSNLSFPTEKHSIEGSVGSGKYLISLHTTVGSLKIESIQP
jgi:DUF4097 and DUF4098 domain-containing protein YvlB